MKVAIVHDYLTQRGGAERVVLSMLKAFPDAPLYTSVFYPQGTFPAFASADVRTLPINRMHPLRRHHRLAFPLLAPSFAAHRVDADVVLCSSSGWAHGVRTTGRKIVYCYSPARWLYQGSTYLGPGRSLTRGALAVARAPLIAWDRKSARSASRYLTLSRIVRDRIQDTYAIDAEILPPPHTMEVDGPRRPQDNLEPGFFLCVSRLLAYKNVDAIVAAFSEMTNERLVVVGTGPEEPRLRRLSGTDVTFLGVVDDEQLRWLYANCVAVVAASHEDYGLTPLEAAAFGKPVAVLRGGGFLDTVIEPSTGVFFDSPTPRDIAAAVHRIRRTAWDVNALQDHARRFDEVSFIERLRRIVLDGAAAGSGAGSLH